MTNGKFIYEDYLQVVDCFNNLHDNRASYICKIINITKQKVDYYIDVYLSMKNNYMGIYVKPPNSLFMYENDKYNVSNIEYYKCRLYLDGVFIDDFTNITNLKREIDLCIGSKFMNELKTYNKVIFKSSKLNKIVKIIKL